MKEVAVAYYVMGWLVSIPGWTSKQNTKKGTLNCRSRYSRIKLTHATCVVRKAWP